MLLNSNHVIVFVCILPWFATCENMACSEIICNNSTSLTMDKCNFKETIEFIEHLSGHQRDEIKQIRFTNSHVPNIPKGIFTKIRYLEYIDFSSCHLAVLSRYNFSAAFNLLDLNLSYNNLDALENSVFDGAYNLANINLEHNYITTIESQAFKYLDKLLKINLANNRITDLAPNTFSTMPKLQVIDVSNNRISTINHWSDFGDLEHLNLNFNRLVDVSLGDLTKIKNISLNNNQIKILKINKFVKVLNANNNQLINKQLFMCENSNLFELRLANNFLTSMEFVKNLSGLTQLNLSYNPMRSGRTENGIFTNLKRLKILILSKVNLNLFDFEFFSDFRTLEHLDISYNFLNATNLKWLEYLENLQYLNLNDNYFNTTHFEEFEYLVPNLKSISISNNHWQCDNLVEVLRRFKKLDIKLIVISSGYETKPIIGESNIRGIRCDNYVRPTIKQARDDNLVIISSVATNSSYGSDMLSIGILICIGLIVASTLILGFKLKRLRTSFKVIRSNTQELRLL